MFKTEIIASARRQAQGQAPHDQAHAAHVADRRQAAPRLGRAAWVWRRLPQQGKVHMAISMARCAASWLMAWVNVMGQTFGFLGSVHAAHAIGGVGVQVTGTGAWR